MAEFDARLLERIAGLEKRHRRVVQPAADVAAKRMVALATGRAQLVSSPVSPGSPVVCLDNAGKCSQPWCIDLVGEGHYREAASEPTWVEGCVLSVLVPCRDCPACDRAKTWMWSDRAVREWRASVRTWFLTLTYPAEGETWLKRMYQAEQRFGVGFAQLPQDEKRRLYADECGRDLRQYTFALRNYALRRHARVYSTTVRGIRGSAGLRQFAAVEFTKKGVVHFHMLLHETDPAFDLTNDALEMLWPHGIVHARLVRHERQARYVAKYVGKGNTGRVRASPLYGRRDGDDLVDEVLPSLKF